MALLKVLPGLSDFLDTTFSQLPDRNENTRKKCCLFVTHGIFNMLGHKNTQFLPIKS